MNAWPTKVKTALLFARGSFFCLGGWKRKELQSSQMTIGAAGLDCPSHGSHAAFGD